MPRLTMARAHIQWTTPDAEVLVAFEPTEAELAPHVDALVAAYNDPRNAALLGHTAHLAASDVRAHYDTLRADGAHPLLFLRDAHLVGDGDLRGIASLLGTRDRVAEFAFLVAAPGNQGRGLGTRFATMVHALAFGPLALTRVYASVIPSNAASLRVFEKLGYELDTSAAARAIADAGDVTLSITRTGFCSRHAEAMAGIVVAMR